MGNKGEGLSDPHPLHHDEGGAVHEAECLVWEGLGDMPGSLQLDRLWDHDGDLRCSQGFPEGEGSRPAKMGIEEGSRFRDDEIGGDERCPSRMLGIETARFLVMAI
jgi:hypothetical protein